MLELRREKLSYEAVAAQMNQEGIPTRAHGVWHAMAVHRIIKRTSTVQAK